MSGNNKTEIESWVIQGINSGCQREEWWTDERNWWRRLVKETGEGEQTFSIK